MADIISGLGVDLLEEEIDDVIFQTNEFLCDATFTGSQGPFWWILQMCMALAALFSIIVAAGMAYKMMVKNEPLDVMKLFRPLFVSVNLFAEALCDFSFMVGTSFRFDWVSSFRFFRFLFCMDHAVRTRTKKLKSNNERLLSRTYPRTPGGYPSVSFSAGKG